MMKSIIKIITAFFLLSFSTVLRSHARMLPAAGENGTSKLVNKEKEWMSMVAEQIITSSSFISHYRKPRPSAPPSPRSAPPRQPGKSDYKPQSSSLLKFWNIISGMIRKATQQPPPAPSTSAPRSGMSNYRKGLPPPPPPPHPSPTIGHIILATPLKPEMSDYGKVARSPPPAPFTSPAKGDAESTIDVIFGRLLKSPPPRDIWIADC